MKEGGLRREERKMQKGRRRKEDERRKIIDERRRIKEGRKKDKERKTKEGRRGGREEEVILDEGVMVVSKRGGRRRDRWKQPRTPTEREEVCVCVCVYLSLTSSSLSSPFSAIILFPSLPPCLCLSDIIIIFLSCYRLQHNLSLSPFL
jgi:hypothetical protein